MSDIGELFQTTRESAGISLEEVSKDLSIKVEILENIEEGKVGAFKDIFELKEYISSYAKYLGIDANKVIDEFNEYMFEYTSKIPVKEIEKTIELKIKEEDKENKVLSPYTKISKKYNNIVYIIVYVVIFIMVLLVIAWSIKQVTIGQNETTEISYRR